MEKSKARKRESFAAREKKSGKIAKQTMHSILDIGWTKKNTIKINGIDLSATFKCCIRTRNRISNASYVKRSIHKGNGWMNERNERTNEWMWRKKILRIAYVRYWICMFNNLLCFSQNNGQQQDDAMQNKHTVQNENSLGGNGQNMQWMYSASHSCARYVCMYALYITTCYIAEILALQNEIVYGDSFDCRAVHSTQYVYLSICMYVCVYCKNWFSLRHSYRYTTANK